MNNKTKEIKIELQNNKWISATIFHPSDVELKAAIMIAPATGIKRRFYSSFANYLAQNGFGVITYDNQGIGDSLTDKIKNSKITLQDWGEKDMPAVLKALQENFPQTKYHLIGHSAGGQLVGLMHNWSKLKSVFNVASSSGRTKNLKFPYLIKAYFFMNFFIPISNILFGYTKTQWMGMGEPLPKNVAKQWREWCNGKGYVKTAFGKTIDKHWYNNINLPFFWLNASDDDIANDENVTDMIEVFPKISIERLKLKPSEYGLKEIGHMKFFSRKNKKIWEIAIKWLERN